jgi:hypothetical protein
VRLSSTISNDGRRKRRRLKKLKWTITHISARRRD